MGNIVGTVFVVLGVTLLLIALLALLAPDILEEIVVRLPTSEDREPFWGWQLWFVANFWPFLIGGAVLVWVGTSLRR